MKRLFLFLGTFFFLFSTVSFQAFADYIDDFSTISSSEGIGYYNLSPGEGSHPNLPKNGFAVLENPGPRRGGAVYYGTGITGVTVEIYSLTGTSITQGKDNAFLLGLPRNQGGTPVAQSALYSPSYNGVYMNNNNQWLKGIYKKEEGVLFLPTLEVPLDAVPYGLHVSVSLDGVSYTTLPLRKTREGFIAETELVFEVWEAPVVGKHSYVKVEINDTSVLKTVEGETIGKNPYSMTMLAQVRLGGYSIHFGPPVPVKDKETITTPPEKDKGEQVSATKNPAPTVTKKKTLVKSATENSPQTTGSSSEKIEVIPKESSSTNTNKFSGVITPPVSSTERKAIGTPVPQEKKAATTEGEEGGNSEDIQEDVLRFQESAPPQKNAFGKGITLYIIGITGVLLYVLLSPKKQNVQRNPQEKDKESIK